LQEKGLGAEVWFNVEVDVNGKVCSNTYTYLKVSPFDERW